MKRLLPSSLPPHLFQLLLPSNLLGPHVGHPLQLCRKPPHPLMNHQKMMILLDFRLGIALLGFYRGFLFWFLLWLSLEVLYSMFNHENFQIESAGIEWDGIFLFVYSSAVFTCFSRCGQWGDRTIRRALYWSGALP